MITNIYLVVAVLFRLVSVGLLMYAAFVVTVTTLMGLIMRNGLGLISLTAVVPAICAGIVLWLLAKPRREWSLTDWTDDFETLC